MAVSPWYKVAVPRQDLRKRKPLDAAQFAVHLDRVAAGDARAGEYLDPELFLSRTYLTEGLRRFAGEVLRRLAGEREGSNAVLNLVTGFGGGKTHSLTLLYHLARLGPEAEGLPGVPELLDAARLDHVPRAHVAVFVGTDWDAVAGRGGDGEPVRRTPWGELAWQFATQAGDRRLFEAVAEQDEARVRPGKDVIRRMLPEGPVLVLMDEVMNFMTAARGVPVGKSTLASQFYEFLHALTEEADSRDGLCVVVSLPKSEEEMSAEDQSDFRRLQKVTTRVATPYVLARDLEIPEIVRRRLFERVGASEDVARTARAFARWLQDHRDLIPGWFPVDRAEEIFRATYPFHPTVLSVFERKWQALPSFQRTRGILRLLAQWVSIAYEEGFKGAHEDALIALGSAPLEDPYFRAAVLEQLGSEELQAAIISDIAGGQAHADRLDEDPGVPESLRRARIHRRVAAAVFFESSGGQVRERATLPEVRLAVGAPDLEIGNVETALEALRDVCYFLLAEGSEYRFSTKPNLNKLIADRRAALGDEEVEERALRAVRTVFNSTKGLGRPFEVVFFPEESRAITDTPALRLVVLHPDRPWGEATRERVEAWMREHGASPRRFRNALIWAAVDAGNGLFDAARRARAWESLAEEAEERRFEPSQRAELEQQRARAARDLEEAVWRSYRWVAFLGEGGEIAEEDLGVVHSSAAPCLQGLIQARLRQRDELADALGPNRVVQNWPVSGAERVSEWSCKAFRDAVYSSPAFPRVLDPGALRATVARGVREGLFGLGAKSADGFVRVVIDEDLSPEEVEFSEDVVLLLPDVARRLKVEAPSPEKPVPEPAGGRPTPGGPGPGLPTQPPIFTGEKVAGVRWEGEVPWQKWQIFYNKVLSTLARGGLRIVVRFESRPEGGLLKERVEELRESLRELDVSTSLDLDED